MCTTTGGMSHSSVRLDDQLLRSLSGVRHVRGELWAIHLSADDGSGRHGSRRLAVEWLTLCSSGQRDGGIATLSLRTLTDIVTLAHGDRAAGTRDELSADCDQTFHSGLAVSISSTHAVVERDLQRRGDMAQASLARALLGRHSAPPLHYRLRASDGRLPVARRPGSELRGHAGALQHEPQEVLQHSVDSGTYFGTSDLPVRNAYRATSAHSVLVVNGLEMQRSR